MFSRHTNGILDFLRSNNDNLRILSQDRRKRMRGWYVPNGFVFSQKFSHALFRAFAVFPQQINNNPAYAPVVRAHNI
jgi:hypothetical protein